MELIAYDEKTDDTTLKLTNVELCEIAACLGYLASTFDEQDSVLLSLPGEQGFERVSDLDKKIHDIIDKLNDQYNKH